MNNDLKPKIRFKGFTDDWEQRKVQGLVDESIIDTPMDGNHGEKHPTAKDYIENGIPFLMASDIHNGIADIDNCKFISEERANRLDKGFAKNDDVLITHKATIGEVAILKDLRTEYAMLTPQVTYYRIKDNSRLNQKYLYAWFNSKSFQKEIKSKAEQSTRAYIGISSQRDLTIQMPNSVDEQEVIGSFIYNLYNLITLHQRKCDKLVELKKSLLEKMFPQNNSKIPEIRFKGFTDDWEQRKLNQFTKYVTSNKTAADAINDGLYDLYDANNIVGKVNDGIVSEEYITIIKDGSGVGKVRRLPKNTGFIGTMGGIVIKDSDIDFIYCNLLRTDFTKEVNGATIPHVYYSSYGNNEYFVPDLIEQEKIGKIFNELDNLITLHQRKHDKLNKIKQSLLNDMFV